MTPDTSKDYAAAGSGVTDGAQPRRPTGPDQVARAAGALVGGRGPDATFGLAVEARLSVTQQRSSGLLEALPDAVVVVDDDGRIQETNAAAETLFGYRRDDMVGRPVELLVPPEARAIHRKHRSGFSTTASTAMGPGRELVARRRDGSTIPVEINLATAELPLGRRVVASIRDVTDSRRVQRELRSTNQLLSGVLDASTDLMVIAVDPENRIILWSKGAERISGYRADERLGRSPNDLFDLVDPEDGPAVARGFEGDEERFVDAPGAEVTGEWTIVAKDGRQVNLSSSTRPMLADDGTVTGYVSVCVDITARKAAERALAQSEERFRLTFEAAPLPMAIIGLHGSDAGRYLEVNGPMCRMTGYSEQELIGQHLRLVNSPEGADEASDIVEAMRTGRVDYWQQEKPYRRADGSTVWVRITASVVHDGAGRPDYVVSQMEDITDRKQAEERLEHLALYDGLTGLPNRSLLFDHLQLALARARRDGTHVGLLFMDLDNFKEVNDRLGHDAGDEYLTGVASCLSRSLRPSDTAARLGGDEFVILCEALRGTQEVESVAARIMESLSQGIVLHGETVVPAASIGIALSVADSTPEQLLKLADTAMYRAKEQGKAQWVVFHPTTP